MQKKWTELGFELYWQFAQEPYAKRTGRHDILGTTYAKDDIEHRRIIHDMAILKNE